MFKLHYFLSFLICFPLVLSAQTVDHTPVRSDIVYLKEHLFLRNNSDFNVVDLDVEWPSVVDYTSVKPLQSALAMMAFGQDTTDLKVARREFLRPMGQPVTQQLERIPDDDRFCYITLKVTMKAYQPGKWIAFLVQYTAEPQTRSRVQAAKAVRSVVYDIRRHKVLTVDQMIRKSAIEDGRADDNFYASLLAPLSDEDYDGLKSTSIDGVWPDKDQVTFHLTNTTDTRIISYEAQLPYQQVRYLVAKNARQLMEKKVDPGQPEFYYLSDTWQGDSVYRQVDVMPQFVGGQAAMNTYISRSGTPLSVGIQGRVTVAFIVDKEGEVHDVHVIGLLTPEASRHAASLVRNMPRFTPGMLHGQPVAVRIYLPIAYQ